VVDHHVDRPGVEAQQCVKLTGTNSSIDLITLIIRARLGRRRDVRVPGQNDQLLLCFAGLVVLARSLEPDPIPNSAVKLLSADDTSSQDAGK
jgi:hypothetical protein